MTRYAVLTPPGSSAIAVFGIVGPGAWSTVQRYFRAINGQPLAAPPSRPRYGRFGDQHADEVMLVRRRDDAYEVHCHGGQVVVEWLEKHLRAAGLTRSDWKETADLCHVHHPADYLLPHARTLRTAGILLDQARGAYDRAIESNDPEQLAIVRRNADVGRHLIEPWRVCLAGKPNAGKSSLVNALAGFDRSIVSPVAGTTRDALSVFVAFDGWPIELFDTAGLRDTTDDLEVAGIGMAHQALALAELVVWVVDATDQDHINDQLLQLGDLSRVIVVVNKVDVASGPVIPGAVRVSALTKEGLAELVRKVVERLVPFPPAPGDPVPWMPELCDRWSTN